MVASLTIVLTMSACGGGSGDNTPPPPPPPPTNVVQQNAPTSADLSLGQVYVSGENLTLYVFENDRNDADDDGAGDSDCNGTCAEIWPPLLAADSSQASGQFTIITRDDDATLQWAYKGLPLYKFNTDEELGDIDGEGVNDIWFVARPDPFKMSDVEGTANGTVFVGDFTIYATDGSGGIATDRVDKDGFTLYTFENDRNDTDEDGAGDSDCNGGCAEIWPPLFAEKGSTALGEFSIIARDDGNDQWAYKGLPLYFFANDAAAGDTNGEAVNDIWYVARPSPTKLSDSTLGTIISSATTISDVDGSGGIDLTTRARKDFSLYVFDNDANDAGEDGVGDSDCNGGCAEIWPPLYADLGAIATGNYSIISRDDGSQQWAYLGEPLYFFVNDAAAGDVNGDQVNDIWHLARTAPVQVVTDDVLGDIFAARGNISDVDDNGGRASTSSFRTGYTVYFFDDDVSDTDGDGAGDSDCNGSCAVTWPPLYANESDLAGGDFTIITRDDGSLQWAYQELPLYFFVGDTEVGATTGVYGTWHEVNP